jgi:hypothetical protein
MLQRIDAGAIGNVLQCHAKGIRCHVLGGTRDSERVLEDVRRVKRATIAQESTLSAACPVRVPAFSAVCGPVDAPNAELSMAVTGGAKLVWFSTLVKVVSKRA